MARPSIIPAVLVRLTNYLNNCEEAYLEQPEGQRRATLPVTPDGKINVRALAKAIELKETQEKYLYERAELTQLINLMCEGQGLLPIGSRLTQTASDNAIKERLIAQAKAARDASQAVVEAQAAQQELLDKVGALTVELEHVKAENKRLHAQIDAIHEGIYLKVAP